MNSRNYFDTVAPRWDEMRRRFYSDAVREKAYAAAGVRADTVAADIGTGTGFISEGLLARGVRVIAVDQSPAMIEELRRKLPNVDGRIGEAERLPIEDCAVDFAFANMYLHHVEHPAVAIREMARILKPGGRIVITDLDEHPYESLKEEHHDRWMGFPRKDVEGWLAQAGLGGVRTDCVGERCCDDTASIGMFLAVAEKRGRPAVPPGPIISLVYRVSPEKRAGLLEFLRRNFPFYERPGGVRMALYESMDEPGFLFELVAYDSEESFAADQERVEKDPEMRSVLSEWKRFIESPVEFRRMRPVPLP